MGERHSCSIENDTDYDLWVDDNLRKGPGGVHHIWVYKPFGDTLSLVRNGVKVYKTRIEWYQHQGKRHLASDFFP